MNHKSVSECLMYSTVRITNSEGGCGTASFFEFKYGAYKIPVLITNKHIIAGNEIEGNNVVETTTFYMHLSDENKEPRSNIKIKYKTKWYFHRTQDLCFCLLDPLLKHVQKECGKKAYVFTNDESIIPNSQELKELSAVEEIIMIGYPRALWDYRNNLPIFRRGITACHPYIDFNNDGIGLIDIACFPGSSGSPIYIFNSFGYSDNMSKNFISMPRLILLGFLSSVPIYKAAGEILIDKNSTIPPIGIQAEIMMNLGFYIKSQELLEFKDTIKEIYKSQNLERKSID